MILKSSYFNQLNGFNTSFYPAWYEDVDLCKRIANNNLVSAISNITQVYHLGGESLHSLHSGRFYSIFLANKIRYYSLHESKSPLNIVAIILIFIEFIFKRLYITFRDYKTMGVSENASLVLKDFKTFISSQQATN
jgi:GT2 family glycosyltransferase